MLRHLFIGRDITRSVIISNKIMSRHTNILPLLRYQSSTTATTPGAGKKTINTTTTKQQFQEEQKTKKIHAMSTNTSDASAYTGGDDFVDYSLIRHTGYMILHGRRLWMPAIMAVVYYATTPFFLTSWILKGSYLTLCVIFQRLSVRGVMNSIQKNLSGYTCVVTGGTSGIGMYTAMQLFDMGAHVIIASRPGREEITREYFQTHCKCIKKDENSMKILEERLSFASLELSDQLDVMACAARIKGKFHNRIDILVNCAGVWREEPGITKQGFEEHIGINFLGPFHFTEALLPALRRSTYGGRIIYVTCASHNGVHKGNVVRERMMLLPKFEESQVTARCYSASKLGNIYHAQSIAARRYEGIPLNKPSELQPVNVCIADPGFCATQLTTREAPPLLGTGIFARTLRSLWIKDGYEGSQTVVNCCVREEIENGGYYAECKLMPSGLSHRAHDPKSRNEVIQWAMTKTIAKYYTMKSTVEEKSTSASSIPINKEGGTT